MLLSTVVSQRPAGLRGWYQPARLRPHVPGLIIALGTLLALLAIALPWTGWSGLGTEGPSLALLAGGGALIVRGRRGPLAACALAGFAAAALSAVRLGEPAPTAVGMPSLSGFPFAATTPALARPCLWLAVVGGALVGAGALAGAVRLADRWRLPALDRQALRFDVSLILGSRLAIWIVVGVAVAILGVHAGAYTIQGADRPFGPFLNTLISPASADDSGTYLTIALHGYASGQTVGAFFPAYPTLLRLAGWSVGAALVWGIAISLLCFGGALYLLERLIRLDFDVATARLTVALVALFPTAFFFSAVYSESLFMLTSVGALYAARRERWAWAGLAALIAAATRTNGFVILLPLAVLWWTGRRRPADLVWLSWIVLAPLAYLAYAGVHGGGLLSALHSPGSFFGRDFVPLAGIWRGYEALGVGHSEVIDALFMTFALIALVMAVRQLSAAYWSYAALSLFLPLSALEPVEPLASLPRYVMVIFPFELVVARWALRARWRAPLLLGLSTVSLAILAVMFARGGWVA